MGVEQDEDDCVSCEEGKYVLSIINHSLNAQIKLPVQKSGGNFLHLNGISHQERDDEETSPSLNNNVSFEPSSMYIGEEAVKLTLKYFPSIYSKISNKKSLEDCAITIGNMTLPKLEWKTCGVAYSYTDTSSFTVPDQAKREVHCCHNKAIHQEARTRSTSSTSKSCDTKGGVWLSTKKTAILNNKDSEP